MACGFVVNRWLVVLWLTDGLWFCGEPMACGFVVNRWLVVLWLTDGLWFSG